MVRMRSEKSKMLAGEPYDAMDPELREDRDRAHSLCRDLNWAKAEDERQAIVRDLIGPSLRLVVTPPFFCDYGYNIEVAENVYFNANCVLLDICRISIGSNTLFGPGVHIYTVNHPMDAEQRRTGIELGKPVSIEQDVWVGGGSVICPGITIGARTVVGAGSVITRSLPSAVFAAGNPCRVIRGL
jgi:maltose O-acetyltransferase